MMNDDDTTREALPESVTTELTEGESRDASSRQDESQDDTSATHGGIGDETAETTGEATIDGSEEDQPYDADEADKLRKRLRKSEASVRRYQTLILRIIIMILLLWVLFFKVIGLTHMPNGDMHPRIDAGDLLMFYRLDTDVQAQDIIVIEKETPDSDGKKALVVSRVIAIPGDEVDIRDKQVYVNGEAQVESDIFYLTPIYQGRPDYPITLGEDEVFVLADAREEGGDSRWFGPVKKDEIQGTVISLLRRNNL